MANFQTVGTAMNSLNQATALLNEVQNVYRAAKTVQAKLALYTANTDPIYTTAINAIYTTAERAELAVMLTTINALVTDWETSHRNPLGLP
jgi:DNA-binding transcriptional regulator YiaG